MHGKLEARIPMKQTVETQRDALHCKVHNSLDKIINP
jgi:hypothetical protein